jgi:hypothetical protein
MGFIKVGIIILVIYMVIAMGFGYMLSKSAGEDTTFMELLKYTLTFPKVVASMIFK